MASHDSTLEYLTTTKIGEKGQLTVPKQFREDLGLGSGAPFAVLRLGDGLILLPEQQRFEQLCEKVSASLASAGLTPDDLLTTLLKPVTECTSASTERSLQQALPNGDLEANAGSDSAA